MTREIKFRAWNKLPYSDPESEFYVPPQSMVPWEEIQGDRNKWLDEERLGQEFVLLQYTGLKDKNGREIYEGDILNVSGVATDFCTVEYSNSHCAFLRTWCGKDGRERFSIELPSINEIEVIGNIYENPNLLTV